MESISVEAGTMDGNALTRAPASADDIARAEQNAITATHMETLKEFVGELNKAAKNVLARKRQYDEVFALVTYWSAEVSDRQYLKGHATELWRVFKDTFSFDVGEEPFEIPAQDPRSAFSDICGETLKRAKSGKGRTNLFILYYGGHASAEDGWNGKVTWESDIKGTKKIYWSSFQDRLEEAGCDLLFVFDCCYGGAMMNPAWDFPQRCELLCSSSPKVETIGTEEHSFTAVLTSVLKEEYKKNGNCDIITLSSILSDTGRVESLETDPYYIMLSKPTQPSILLHSTAKPHADALTIPRLKEMSDARVLFKVSFLDYEIKPLVKEWEQFLHFRPGNISSIEAYALDEMAIHCCFETCSCSASVRIHRSH